MPDIAASSTDALRAPPAEERALLAACLGGDSGAFVELARRHHPALRALAGCWPGPAHEAERDVAQAWLAVLPAASRSSGASLRALAGREVARGASARTGAPLEMAPPSAGLDGDRFFGADHELWPGEWADPPRPWGPAARRRLAGDMPRALGRAVRELGVAPSAVLTLCDLHGWPVRECAFALDHPEEHIRAFLRAGRESVRAALEQEVDSL